MYDTVVSPLCERFLTGESCSLIAYGMTNAGKTHTIQGTGKQVGIFPRLVTAVLNKMTEFEDSMLQLSVLEIYQEKLADLLNARKERLTIRDGNGHIEVAGLTSHIIESVGEASKALDAADSKRSKSRTLLNAGSSRSHAIYTLTLTYKANGRAVASLFQVVDLAGSERGNRTKGNASQQKEANNINCSLMQLWRCLNGIRKINKNSAANQGSLENTRDSASSDQLHPNRRSSHNNNVNISSLPFRESKLTHLLMPQLCTSGLAGIAIVTCINPRSVDYDETITILNNASLACKITELAVISKPPAITKAHRGSSIMSEGEAVEETVTTASAVTGTKKRSFDQAGVHQGPPSKSLRGGKASTGNRTSTFGSKHATSSSLGHKKSAGSIKTITNLATEANDGANIEVNDADNSDLCNELREIAAELKAELERAQEENAALQRYQLVRETEVRAEVCDEMELRSASLLKQLEELQEREAAHYNRMNDVTKSTKKVKRKQIDLENEVVQRDLKEAEEEIMRLKQMHETESGKLRLRITQLEEEVAMWKGKLEQSIISKPVVSIPVTRVEIPQLSRETSTDSSRSLLKNEKKRTVVVNEDGSVSIPKRQPVQLAVNCNSPGRSPLSTLSGDGNIHTQANSPIKLNALKPAPKKTKKGKLTEVLEELPSQVNNENAPSPKQNVLTEMEILEPSDTCKVPLISVDDSSSAINSNMKATKQPSVMRRLRSTLRMI